MTRKEHMLAAIRREPIDHVPFTTYNFHPCMDAPHTKDPGYAELLKLVWEKAGMLCKTQPSRSWPDADPGWARSREVKEEDGHRIETVTQPTPKGDLRQVTVTPPGQPGMVTEHLIKTDEDIARWMSLPLNAPEFDNSNLIEHERQLDGRGLLYVSYPDPMHSVAALFDFQDFAVRCIVQPETLRPMIDRVFEQSKEHVRRLCDACAGMEVLFYSGGPEIATPPMLPPKVFHEFVTPYHRAMVGMFHDAGHLACIHCHGRVRLVLDEFLAIGLDAIEPIEPPPQGDIPLDELLARCEGRMTVIGHIQDQEFHTMPEGTMRRHVEEIAAVAKGRTGYIMSPTCTPFQFPPTDTWLRNYAEWINAADELL